MTTLTRPTIFRKLIAVAIVISFISFFSSNGQTHSLITWALGSSFGAMIIKLILLFTALVMFCVPFYSTEKK